MCAASIARYPQGVHPVEATLQGLLDRLMLFVPRDRANEAVRKALVYAGLDDKPSYSSGEFERLLDAMMAAGGMVEFVARNTKISLLTQSR